MYDTFERKDTVTLLFSALNDSARLVYLLREGADAYSFGPKRLIYIDTAKKSARHGMASSARDALLHTWWAFDPIANRGSGIRALLADTTNLFRESDTMWQRRSMKCARIFNPAPDPSDTSVKNFLVWYVIDHDGAIMESHTEFQRHGHTQTRTCTMLSSRFGVITREEVLAAQRRLLKNIPVIDTLGSVYQEPLGPLSSGAIAPDFMGRSFSGDTLELNHIRGRLLLLDFCYAYCEPCRKLVPELLKLREAYRKYGLTIIAVDPIDTSLASLHAIQHDEGANFTELAVLRAVAEAYKVSIYPTVFVTDENRKILLSVVGYKNARKRLAQIVRKKLEIH
ncbi:MAG TPA: redoxin domain-containing protein [Candidatus Kapabacteria bacterium]|nr:redoxin domain-containing protein [Candidatus Kapabacteria bacterium]